MASAADIHAYSIPSTAISVANTEIFADFFKLLESLDDIENGGSFQSFLLFFAVSHTTDNLEMLDNYFTDGKGHWTTKFVKRYRTDAKDKDDVHGWCYFPSRELLTNISSEKAYILLLNSFTVSSSVDVPDCWGDMILFIFVIVIITYITAGTGTGTSLAWFTAVVSSTTVALRIQLPFELQIVMAIVSLGTSIAASAGKWTLQTVMGTLMQACNICLDIYNEVARIEHEEDLKELADKEKALDKLMEAEGFYTTMNYTYKEIYDSTYRKGHEADPHREIRKQYLDFTSYPAVGMDETWIKQE